MKNSIVSLLACGSALAALVVSPVSMNAANVTWDGGAGGANASDLWETGANWSADIIPGTTDNAQLLDVTSGTRTVTISSGSPETISKLTITQTTTGAVNVLDVDDNLTISGNATPFAITATAGQGSIVTSIADGKTLLATSTGSMTATYAGTINLGAGSTFELQTSGAASDLLSTTINGPVNATGAGAQVLFQAGRFISQGVTFGGALTVSDGASLTVEALNAAGTGTGSISAVKFTGADGNPNSLSVGAGGTANLSILGGTYTFSNEVALAAASNPAAGGILTVGVVSTGSSTTTLNYNGGLMMGAGAQQTVQDSSALLNLAGTSFMDTGATLTMQYSSSQGVVVVANAGTFTMNDASINLDWTASGNNNPAASGRRFMNSGTWTLENGSSLAFISSAGRVTSGFGVGSANTNSGTLNVLSGSSLGFLDLLNTGIVTAGSATAGVSDATVNLGSPAGTFTNVVLNNGYTSGNATLNILGNTLLGRASSSLGTTYLDNGTARTGVALTTATDASTGSVITIGDGSTPTLFTLSNNAITVTNATGNTMDINANAAVLLTSTATATSPGATTVSNEGTITQAGNLEFQGNFNGARSVTNTASSIYGISGVNATITALAGNGSGSNVAAIAFTSSGLITGSSAHDKLAYVNSTGNGAQNTLSLTMSSGEITPGNGTHGSGVSSIGTLEFANTNITLTGATKLSFDIGGLGNDTAPLDGENNPILTFDRILLGASQTFALGTGAVLDIWLTNGFTTDSAQTYTLIDTGLGGEGTVTGTFASLLFEGQAVTDQYTVNVANGSMSITLAAGLGTPIPEPSASVLFAALGVAAVVVTVRRRRSA